MAMRLATVLTPISSENLRLAAQCGVEEVVSRYPMHQAESLPAVKRRIESFGMRLSVVEGYLPIERIKIGRDQDGRDMAELKALVRDMGELGIPLLCYNFMAGTDWVRTDLRRVARGGALVTAFDLADVQRAVTLNQQNASAIGENSIDAASLWRNLDRFLQEMLPVAERAGVTLTMHPDDPPVPELLGKARIMHSLEGFERLMQLAPSPHNAICFCQGTFAAMGLDIPAAIRRLGKHIKYVHFRDVRGSSASFVETFHDDGPTDMVAAMRAYREMGFTGPMRPDHVPQLEGEAEGEPGYTMQGRLFAYGYMRGLMQAIL
jgi:mannonate dehydratase